MLLAKPLIKVNWLIPELHSNDKWIIIFSALYPLLWLKLKVLNTTSLLLDWSEENKPTRKGNLSEVEGFRLRYTSNPNADVGNWTEMVFGSSHTDWTFTDLMPGQSYYFKIAPVVDGQLGEFSNTVKTELANNDSMMTRPPVVITKTSYIEGLLIGTAIALSVLVFCSLLLFCKNRWVAMSTIAKLNDMFSLFCRRHSWQNSSGVAGQHWWSSNGWAGGERPVANGKVLANGTAAGVASIEAVELQTLLPPFIDAHLDTKGGENGPQPSGCSRLNKLPPTQQPTSLPMVLPQLHQVHHFIWGKTCKDSKSTWNVQEMGPVEVVVVSGSSGTGRGGSDTSHSPVTASSLHSWSREEHDSQPASSSLPNLTDSGIGFDEPRATAPVGKRGKCSPPHSHHWHRPVSPPPTSLANGLSLLNHYSPCATGT